MGDLEFQTFVDDFFAAEFGWNPAWATRAGLHDNDHRLGDRSREACEARIAEVLGLGKQARDLGRRDLNASDRIDLELIAGRLEAQALELDTLETWRRNPIDYLWHAESALDGLIKRDFASPRTRLEALIARLRSFPQVLAGMKSNIRNPPWEFTEIALRLARGSGPFLDAAIESWAIGAADGDPTLISEFRAVHPGAVSALEDAARFLEALLPQSAGVSSIGGDALSTLLEAEEMTSDSLETLQDVAAANLERDYQDFVRVAARISPDLTPQEVMRALSENRPLSGELLEWARSTVERVRGFLTSRPLVTIPPTPPPTVVETPPYYRFGAFAAMDSPGAYEQVAREAYYYVTPPENDWDPARRDSHLRLFNRPVMDVITIHETYPGHFLQFANAARFPTHTRRLLSCGSNVEGWAHYVEQMMIEEGYGAGDLQIRLAQLQEALIRDCRFVVAIALHTGMMDVAQGAAFFTEKAFMEPDNALEEARRGTFDPTYLSYTLGKLQIYKLRDDWEAKRPGRDLREFHDRLLREGGIPVRLLRRRMLGENETETLYPASEYLRSTHRGAA